MSTYLARGVGTETVGVEVFASYDGQGKPSYSTSVDISAQALREDELVRMSDGTDIWTALKLWIDSGETPIPQRQDRVTQDGDTFIVVRRKPVKSPRGVLDHVKLWCREE